MDELSRLQKENARLREDLEPIKRLAKTLRNTKALMGPVEYQDRPREMKAWQKARYSAGKELWELLRALSHQPAKEGEE